MTGRTHALGGVASLWLLSPIPGAVGTGAATNNFGLLAMMATLGALLPDLDAPESHLKHLAIGGVKPFALPAAALHQAFGHRGLPHSAMGLLLTALLLAVPLGLWLGWQPAAALLLGYASHLALDACTPSGVPLWFPRRRRVHLLPPWMRVVTGSAEEDLVHALLALLTLLLALTHYPIPQMRP